MSSVDIVSDDIEMKLVKNHLIGIGIYEKGMTNNEMLDIYKVIKQSEKSASDEEQYRNTLVATNKNETDLSEVMSENRSLRSNSKIIEKPKRLVEDNNNLSSDSFFPIHNKTNETDKMDNSDFSDTDSDMHKNEQVNGVQSPQKSAKNDTITSYNKTNKHIDPFLTHETKCHLKICNKPYKNEDLPFYCRSDILQMPKSLAVKAIMKYHDIMEDEYKKFQSKSINRARWGKPIPIPIVNRSKATSKSVESPLVTTQKQATSSDNDIVHEHCLRSRRNVKRKSYTEYFSDDDNFELKKSREKCIVGDYDTSESKEDDYTAIRNRIFNDPRDISTEHNLPNFLKDTASSDDEPSVQIEVQALVHNEENANPLKRRCNIVDIGSSKRPLMDNSFEDNVCMARGDEIDNADEEVIENKINNNHVEDKIEQVEDPDCIISSTNDENIYPRRIIPPNPVRDISSVRSEQRIKNAARRRNKNPSSITKPESQRTVEEKDEEVDSIFDMSPKKCYGTKNKVFPSSPALENTKNDTKFNSNPIRVTRSIKSKQKSEENEEKCPLCSEYFATSFIEVHAASCALPVKNFTLCQKCDTVYTDYHVCTQDDVIFDTTKK